MKKQKRNNSRFYLTVLVAFAIVVSLGQKSSAAPVTGFEPGRIMDDAVMANSQSMTVAQIQAFLDSKVPVCDSDGSKGSTPTSRKEYFVKNGWPIPIVCLRNYVENSKSSAQIIYDVSQEFKINPQVLIVLLQKEQGLVTDNWPDPTQYRSATGYGCPDTAVCETKYYGFTNQVRNAANMFRRILDASPSWDTPYIIGTNNIRYNPNPNCGSTTVNIQNRATQALYNYTPYQPNKAALSAGYGTGDGCSAYGNRNFYNYFTDWFGSTYGIITELGTRYNEIANNIGTPSDMGYCSPGKTICWQQFEKGFIIYSPGTGAWESKGSIRESWAKLNYQSGVAGFPIGPEVYNETTKAWSQKYEKGIITGVWGKGFWFIPTKINERWQKLEEKVGTLGMPVASAVYSGELTWQEFEKGFIIYSPGTGAWESKGSIRESWASIGYQSGVAGLPIGPEVYDGATDTWSQEYQKGVILGKWGKGFYFIPTKINARWQELGSKTGALGMPVARAVSSGELAWQEFEKGFIISDPFGAWESKGAIRAYWASVGYQSGETGTPNGPEIYDEATNTWSQDYAFATIYYSDAKGAWMTMKDM